MSTRKLAFVGTPVTHAQFLAEIIRHREADRITQGTYWTEGKGCAVGCAIESLRRVTQNTELRHDSHQDYAEHTNIPIEIIYLQERLFEGLAASVAVDWPVAFASAVTEGADLSGVSRRFLVRMLREIVLPVAGESAHVVTRVADGVASDWKNGDTSDAARDAAAAASASASDAASDAASVAAWAAAWAAASDTASDTASPAAARAASDAAYTAAYAAAYAASAAAACAAAACAASVAAAAAYERMSHILLEELRAASFGLPLPATVVTPEMEAAS